VVERALMRRGPGQGFDLNLDLLTVPLRLALFVMSTVTNAVTVIERQRIEERRNQVNWT
jgi:hypothetical protein